MRVLYFLGEILGMELILVTITRAISTTDLTTQTICKNIKLLFKKE
jgi:hypothetical protein